MHVFGYNDESKTYKLSQQIIFFRNVIFYENFIFLSILSMLEAPLKDVDNDELLLDFACFKTHTRSSKYL